MFMRSAVAIAIGASSAVVAMLPGPIDASAAPSTKNMIGTSPTLPAAEAHRVVGHDVERAVARAPG